MTELKKLYDAIVAGDAKTSLAITKEALAENVTPGELVANYMIPAMDEVGKRFECEDYFVPELLLSGRAMKAALEILRPLLASRLTVVFSAARCGVRKAQMVPNALMGTLTQNTARQSQAASSPPSSKPRNCPQITEIWLMPSAMPRWRAGKAPVRMAAELAISIAPPNA